STRPHQVQLELRPENTSGGISSRRRHAGKHTGDLAEGRKLFGVERMIEVLGAGEMAHDQRDAVIAGIDPGNDALRLNDSEAQPVHAGIDMNGRAARPAGAPAT